MDKNYVSPGRLSLFFDELKRVFATLTHEHALSEISDYAVDNALSSTSENPIQNKTVTTELDTVNGAIGALESTVSQKSQVQIITWEASD